MSAAADTSTFSIRVHNFWGDLDSLHDLIVVGPYPDAAARNADLYRLAALPGMHGVAKFEPSTLGTAGVDTHASPVKVAAALDFETFIDCLYRTEDGS